MNEHHLVENVRIEGRILYLMVDGNAHRYPIKDVCLPRPKTRIYGSLRFHHRDTAFIGLP